MFILQLTNASENLQRISTNFILGSGTIANVPISVAANGTVVFSGTVNAPEAFPPVITGFTKTGAGVLRFAATNNNFIGRSLISEGTVQVTSLGSLASSLGTPTTTANSIIRLGNTATSGTLEYIGSVNSTTNRQVAIGAGNGNGGGAIRNNGTGTLTFSSATFNPLELFGAGSTTNNRSLTLGGTNVGNNAIQGVIQNNSSGSTLKTISVAKEDAGKWILSGTNTYTGTTSVNAGTLLINGNQTSATGAVTVASGATLGGTGTIGGATTFQAGANHSPGASPGLQTFASNLTYAINSQLTWELNANTDLGRGANFDGIDVNGVVTISSGAASNLIFNSAGSNVLWSDAFWDIDRSWLVFRNANAPVVSGSIFDSILVSLDSAGNLVDSRGSFSWSQSGNDLLLNFTAGNVTAVPEPSSLLLLGIAGLLPLKIKTES